MVIECRGSVVVGIRQMVVRDNRSVFVRVSAGINDSLAKSLRNRVWGLDWVIGCIECGPRLYRGL